MRFKKILVTGGAGFIGSHLTQALLQSNYEVSVYDNLSTGSIANVPKEAEFIQGDLLDLDLLSKALKGKDAVYHLAARVSIRLSVGEFLGDAKVNLWGTLNLLDLCVRHDIRKIVYASSMAVYADSARPEPISEEYPTQAISPYGVAKLAGEMYFKNISRQQGIDCVSLRYFNTYGPRQTYTPYVGVITIFINRLLSGQPPIIFGDGEQRRDFVYVGDIVRANLLALDYQANGEVFNVGTGKPTSVNEIAKLLCRRLNPDLAPVYDAERPGELRNSIADITKIKKSLGYLPQATLAEKIDEIIEWNRRGR